MIQYYAAMHVHHESVCGLPKSSSNKPQISKQSCSSASSTKDFGTNGTANSGAWPAKLYEKDDKMSSTPKQKQPHAMFWYHFWVQFLGTKDVFFSRNKQGTRSWPHSRHENVAPWRTPKPIISATERICRGAGRSHRQDFRMSQGLKDFKTSRLQFDWHDFKLSKMLGFP